MSTTMGSMICTHTLSASAAKRCGAYGKKMCLLWICLRDSTSTPPHTYFADFVLTAADLAALYGNAIDQ